MKMASTKLFLVRPSVRPPTPLTPFLPPSLSLSLYPLFALSNWWPPSIRCQAAPLPRPPSAPGRGTWRVARGHELRQAHALCRSAFDYFYWASKNGLYEVWFVSAWLATERNYQWITLERICGEEACRGNLAALQACVRSKWGWVGGWCALKRSVTKRRPF